jgi:hypothetical protein
MRFYRGFAAWVDFQKQENGFMRGLKPPPPSVPFDEKQKQKQMQVLRLAVLAQDDKLVGLLRMTNLLGCSG